MYNEGFPEGKEVFKQHLMKERNRGLVSLAKKQFLETHGKLFCETCGFDFAEHYGDVGEGYIEAHHIKPLSEMHMNEKTRVEDLMMVCSNCHRMIHRKKPWLTGDELKNLLSGRGDTKC
ncbi:HNH endonuclease [Salinicoccus roseus]|nr:HNH endonuclease [Salinicoccus roseus]